MCELNDALCISIADANGDYVPVVYLDCCQCNTSTAPVNDYQPFCDSCFQKLHRKPLEDGMTRCDRCGIVARGILPLPMCIACQSITNYEGYNERLRELVEK